MAGMLTEATYNRFEKTAKLVATLNDSTSRNIGPGGAAPIDMVGGEDRVIPIYPHAFDVSLTDELGASGVWVFLPKGFTDKFYNLSQDAATPEGAGPNHIEYPTGVWCRAFGLPTVSDAPVLSAVYFIADYAAAPQAGLTPFAFVVLPYDTPLSVPPFLRAVHVATITEDSECYPSDVSGSSFDRPVAGAWQCVIGFGLRLAEIDLTTEITHKVCSAVYEAATHEAALLTKLACNSDVRTFLSITGTLNQLVSADNTTWAGFVPGAATVKNVSFAPNTSSETPNTLHTLVSSNSYWLGIAAVATSNGADTRVSITPLSLGARRVYVHGGYINTLPDKCFSMTVSGGLALFFERSVRTTFWYSDGHIWNDGKAQPLSLALGVLTGYINQQVAGGAAIFSATQATPPAGQTFPTTRLTVTFTVNSYTDMEKYNTFTLIGADGWPTPAMPLDPEAIHITVCDQPGGDSLDFNSHATQEAVRFPTSQPDSGLLTGCAWKIRVPVVQAPDTASRGVTYVQAVDSLNREVVLQGVTVTPPASTQQRVYARASDGNWGLFELEMLFQLDAVNKRFYYNPQKYTDNGTQKLLDAAHPTDKFDFQWDSNIINGVKIQVLADVRINPTTGALEKSYRYIELPKVLVAHVSAMSAYETVIEKEEC